VFDTTIVGKITAFSHVVGLSVQLLCVDGFFKGVNLTEILRETKKNQFSAGASRQQRRRESETATPCETQHCIVFAKR